MERVVERDELMLVFVWRHRLSDLAGELDGSFVGFGAAVANERSGRTGKTTSRVCKLDKLFGKKAGMWVVVQIRGVHELLGLDTSQ